MSRHLRGAPCALALLVAGVTAPSAAAEVKPDNWSHRAAIEITRGADASLVEFALTPEVHDAARPDLADLRVLDDGGRESPYVLRRSEGATQLAPLRAKVYNRTFLPGSRSVTVDFREKALKNSIEVSVRGTNFRREVLVEGSDDGTAWQVVRGGALLFRVKAGDSGEHYEKNTVAVPENDFRYLRVTVSHGAHDEADSGIDGVRAWHRVRSPPETTDVRIAGSQVVEKPKERVTDITVDLGWRNLPLHEMTLDFDGTDFLRHASMSGRHAKELVVRTEREDGTQREERVEAPWRRLASTTLYRYTSDGDADGDLTVGLAGANHRYLRIRLQNGDDAPLPFRGAKVSRLVQYVGFRPANGREYTLLFGNPRAPRPSYDLRHYAERLRREGVGAARLADATRTPGWGRDEGVAPWSERHGWLLWVAVAGISAVLALMVWRQAKVARSATGGDQEKGQGRS